VITRQLRFLYKPARDQWMQWMRLPTNWKWSYFILYQRTVDKKQFNFNSINLDRKDCCRICSYKATTNQHLKMHFELRRCIKRKYSFMGFICDWFYTKDLLNKGNIKNSFEEDIPENWTTCWQIYSMSPNLFIITGKSNINRVTYPNDFK